MTLYVEYVDFMPHLQVTPYWSGDDNGGWPAGSKGEVDRAQFPGLPDPMLVALDGLVFGGDGEGRCSHPGCDAMVGWWLDERDDDLGARDGWGCVVLVWDDGPVNGAPRPVLTLCEDHAPADPYDLPDPLREVT